MRVFLMYNLAKGDFREIKCDSSFDSSNESY